MRVISTHSCFYFLLILVLSIVLLSSCLEWRYTYPLLEEAGLEAWAVDVLGWGFSDLGSLIYLNRISYIFHINLILGILVNEYS